MPTIETRRAKDGIRRYRVKIRMKGALDESATFKRLADAKAYARRIEAQITEGRYFPLNEARRRTLSDAIERYNYPAPSGEAATSAAGVVE